MLPVSAQKRSMGSGARRSPLASPWPCSTRQPGVGGSVAPPHNAQQGHTTIAISLCLSLYFALRRCTLRSASRSPSCALPCAAPKPGRTRSRAPCGRGHHLLQQEGFRAVDEADEGKYFELFHAKGKSDSSAHDTTMKPSIPADETPICGEWLRWEDHPTRSGGATYLVAG